MDKLRMDKLRMDIKDDFCYYSPNDSYYEIND